MNMALRLTDCPSIETESSALEARNLTVSYAGVVRLQDISVAFPRNQVTTILGPSGCGKSTLLRALNRTLELIPGARVESGQVLLDQVDIHGPGVSPSWVRTRIGMLQQRPSTFPMSIAENVVFGAKYHGYATDRAAVVEHYLELVGLWEEVRDRLHLPANSLSGGQKQRLCLARTLAVRPSVLLMDEPCSALDPRATALIERLIERLARDYTIIVVTHNIAQAKRIANHCVFMLEGEILASGSRQEVLVKPKHRTVRDFITGRIG